jgi:PAS domain S-box-containing protein
MPRWKVLIVDDQQQITANLQKQLLNDGYEVRVANNFTEAKFIIERFEFDIAILDLILPDGNGIDLYRELRKINDEIYCIMITGNATIENAVTALNEGVDGYLIKPFTSEQLKAALFQAENALKLKAENRSLMKRIQSNRQFYENLLNSTSEAVLVVDLDFMIQYANIAAQKILEVNVEQLKKEFLHNFIDDGYKVLSHIYQQLVLGKSVAGYRVGVKVRDGKSFDAHLSADFLHSKNDHVEGLIINLSNTVVHNELFNRILRKEKLATIINLANALGHEIRNPINILFGRLQLLAEEIEIDKFDHAYDSIKRQIDRLLSITELLTKFNFSKEDSIPERFCLDDILEKVLAQKQKQLNSKQIKVATHFEKRSLIVEGNESQFLDAFGYLIEALVELLSEGKEIEIRGKTISNYASSPMTEIHFIIPDSRIEPEQIFEPYHSKDVKSNSLIGLGMTIMHTIFANYGVKMDAFLQNEKQSFIRIRFPMTETKSKDQKKD